MNPRGRMSASDRRWQQRYQRIQEIREQRRAWADAQTDREVQEPAWRDEGLERTLEYLRRQYERATMTRRRDHPVYFYDEFVGDYWYEEPSTPVDLKDDFESWDVSQIADFYCAFQE